MHAGGVRAHSTRERPEERPEGRVSGGGAPHVGRRAGAFVDVGSKRRAVRERRVLPDACPQLNHPVRPRLCFVADPRGEGVAAEAPAEAAEALRRLAAVGAQRV